MLLDVARGFVRDQAPIDAVRARRSDGRGVIDRVAGEELTERTFGVTRRPPWMPAQARTARPTSKHNPTYLSHYQATPRTNQASPGPGVRLHRTIAVEAS